MSTEDEGLNPNHPVTQAMTTEWHKICAILIHKYNLGEVMITGDDIEALTNDPANNIVVNSGDEGIKLRLVTLEEGMSLARKEGGLRS